MRRFITYMYEYERGIRGRNVGFVRTDLREDICRMELQIRGFERFRGKCPVYLTVYDEGLVAVPVAELLLAQGMGSCSFSCPDNRIADSTFLIRQAQTLTVSCGNGRFLTGCLNASPVPEAFRGDFRIYEQLAPEPPFVMPQETDAHDSDALSFDEGISAYTQNFPPENPPVSQNTPISSDLKPDDVNPEDISSKPQSEHPTPAADSLKPLTDDQNPSAAPSEPLPENRTPATVSSKPQPENTPPESLKTAAVETSPEISYKKIEISDIRRLPKKNWNLCNNRFLIHGFFNYHYLMLKTIEMNGEKRQFLGVPGIYEQPERMMALLFGFPEFDAAAASHSSQKEDLSGVFGYWMCPLT